MSRVGKQTIVIPANTSVEVGDSRVLVKGPLGELSRPLRREVSVAVSDGVVTVKPEADSKLAYALWGTFASHIANMVQGVNEKYEKRLLVEGVGYRAEMQGNKLVMSLGFSHPVEMQIPEGLEVTVEKNEITVRGADKELVGQFSAEVRAKKKPEPYKGKGIRYKDETIRRKEGKKTV